MFTGRLEELRTLEKCLLQTKNDNPQHFLIEGERGIGKSSLMFLTEHIAKGTVDPLYTKGKMSFLTVPVEMASIEDQVDIVRTIGRELRVALAARNQLLEKTKSVLQFLSNWEIMGVRYHREQSSSQSDDTREELVNQLAKLSAEATDEIDGIFIMIDEADTASEDAGLGTFIKLFSEKLARRGCNKVLLGLAGLPSTIPKLRASHESAPRMLEIIKLEPLSVAEREQVVRKGLDAARAKGSDTKITDEALKLIAVLSEGYPHFVQQFAYCAFEEDGDGTIDIKDVESGAYKENGALAQLGHKYFKEMYETRISSEDYRRVLGAMAQHGDAWIERKRIIAESHVSESSVNNALAALKDRKIIQADETRRGFYRLPTNSFAAWINAVRAAKQEPGPDLFTSG